MSERSRRYFLRQIGKSIPFSVTLSSPVRGVVRKEYEVIPRGVDGTYLLASVQSRDYGTTGNQIGLSSKAHGQQRMQMAGIPSPGDVVEAMCRMADPEAFKGRPAQAMAASPEGTASEISRLVEALAQPGGRSDDEAPPSQESVARLRAFVDAHNDLVVPAVFSSKDGTVRARWQHGADRTVFVGFPAQGPLPMTVTFPRTGDYGLVKVNARCIEDSDIPSFCATVGIRITR